MPTVGALFAGIGGWALGLERAGWEVRWLLELETYRRCVLKQTWPRLPVYGDIRRTDLDRLERVTALCGGFPCKDISAPGKGAGLEGLYSGLWTEYTRAICHLRPSYVFVENVALLQRRGLGRVVADLATLGYDAEWSTLRASTFGAPHDRNRMWVVAYLANPYPQRRGSRPRVFRPARWLESADSRLALSRQWASEPSVDRRAYGVPFRSHRTRALGDSVVLQVAQWIGEQVLLWEQQQAA